MEHDRGYVEIRPVLEKFIPKGVHIYYFCGGRGIGKTYSSIAYIHSLATGEIMLTEEESENKVLYLRRTAVEALACTNERSNPFKKFNVNEGTEFTSDFSMNLGFGSIKLGDRLVGYTGALSTFANLRGVDFSDVAFILYDECIPESKNKKPLQREGTLLLNMLETVNRNRSLEGKREVVLVMLSNAIDLGSDLLSQLDLTPVLNNMILQKRERYTDYSRSLHIEKYIDHVISRAKGETSMLYKFAKGTHFSEQSLSGDFVDNDLTVVKQVNLQEYEAYISIENICVYRHKSNGEWYVTNAMSKAKYKFKATEREKIKEVFYFKYKLLVVDRLVYYSTYAVKVIFENMIHYKPFTYL